MPEKSTVSILTLSTLKVTLVLLCLTCMTLPVAWRTARADVLSIPDPAQLPKDLPPRGMTMSGVLEKFGPPLSKKGPVGKPPITRWVYEDFIVNFEQQWVIHSGVKRKK